MDSNDELVFTGSYKSFKLGLRFDIGGKQPGEVAGILSYISSKIEPWAFTFSGINTGCIDEFVAKVGNGVGGVCHFLEEHGPSGIKNGIASALPKDSKVPPNKLMKAAESYFFNRLLEKAVVPFKVPLNAPKPADEKTEDFIGFIGKYEKWVAIKKLGLDNVQDYEVSGILAGINNSIVNKSFEFSGMSKNDSAIDAIAKGKRRSYGNAVLVLKELEPKLNGVEDAYMVCKVLEQIGYKPYASPEMLSEAYPDIKRPKTKGRKPKG